MRQIKSVIAIGLLILAVLIINSHSTSASVEIVKKSLSITHIGDSYSAGNGAGDYYDNTINKTNPQRSRKNWGELYTNWVRSQGISSVYTNLAHSGYTTGDTLDETIGDVPNNTDLVLMTVGGNDIDFNGIITKCFAPLHISAIDCQKKIDNANKSLSNVSKQTEKIFSSLQNKLSPNAEIILVSYPLLSTNINYNDYIEECIGPKERGCKLKTYKYSPAREVRALGIEATKAQKKLVNDWNSKNRLKVTFVDQTSDFFSGHEPDPKPYDRNNHRWINEFFETEGVYISSRGFVESKSSLQASDWYHPNITGHQKIAELVQNQIGIPKSARTITPTSGDIDIAFVVDTTGSMGYSINSVKNNIQEIINETSRKSNSSRFALVSYQDFPESSGIPEDYPSKVHTNFTSDIGKIKTEVANLTLGHGGDWEETAYSGAMAALDLDWRPGVKKIMIILADAPPKDPEPITGYTAQIVARRAFEIDPVEVSLIDSESAEYGGSFQQLVHESDGKLYKSWDEGGVTQAIVNSITSSLAKPFAWIQGPYIVKIGDPITFDARGSYSSNGEIVKYEWDFNGDGVYDKTTTSGETTETFQSEHWGYMGIRITDSTGLSSVGSTEFIVSDDGDSTPRDIDNCPDVYNHAQIDTDGDGIGDECDPTHGVPDWLDGSQNPEGLIDGIIMFKTDIPEYIKLAYGSNDQYIDSLIKDGQSISEINATIRNLNLKISDETNKKLETINSQDQNGEDNQEEEKQNPKPDSAEKPNKSPVAQENKTNNAMIIAIIVAATAIIAIATSVIILIKKRKSI